MFAIKVLHEHLRTAPLEAALVAEARATLGASLPNVLGALDLVEEEPALVMRYVSGVTLDATDGGLAVKWQALLDALDGLEACHARGLVHRDVCPSNVLVDARGRGHLLDFGLAWTAAGYVTEPGGGTQGTFAYISPEQVRAEAPTPQVDVFSCGVIAWELAAARRLHTHGNTAKTLLDVTGVDAPSLLADGCPSTLASCIARALERSPRARTSSAAAFAGELRIALGEAGVDVV